MKPRATFVLSCLGAFLGVAIAFISSVALGHDDARVAGFLGGALGVLAAVFLAIRFGWLPAAVRDNALLGGVLGFALTWFIVMLTIGTIILPFLAFAFVGVGVIVGARRGSNRPSESATVSPNEEL